MQIADVKAIMRRNKTVECDGIKYKVLAAVMLLYPRDDFWYALELQDLRQPKCTVRVDIERVTEVT